MNFFEKVKNALNILNQEIYEREDVFHFALLALFSGESMFLLGPPGVAKSLIARKIKFLIKDARYFEHLMTQYTLPEELFGPVSLPKLKQGFYEREIQGYLPTSEVVFLDEIWKSSSSILNTLLVIINEKKFKQGIKEINVPLKLLISASNEIPEDETLKALWDRFLIRMYVEPIKKHDTFNQYLALSSNNVYEDNIPETIKFTSKEIDSVKKHLDEITINQDVIDFINKFKTKIKERNEENQVLPPIEISDRRWKKIINILKTYALLNQRKYVSVLDCMIIPYMIWNTKEDLKELNEMMKNLIFEEFLEKNPSLKKVHETNQKMNALLEKITNVQIHSFIQENEYKVYKFFIIDEYRKIREYSYYKLILSNNQSNNLLENVEFYINFNDIEFKKNNLINQIINIYQLFPFIQDDKLNKIYIEIPYNAKILDYQQNKIKIFILQYNVDFNFSIDSVKKYYAKTEILETKLKDIIFREQEYLKELNNSNVINSFLQKLNEILKVHYKTFILKSQKQSLKEILFEFEKNFKQIEYKADLIKKLANV